MKSAANPFKTELYKVIKGINSHNLNEEDKKELLNIFKIIKNPLIRDHIALIFSDLQYSKAIPYILKKINEKDARNNNGTLVFSLESMDCRPYFISLIRIICEQDYEPRLWAFDIIANLVKSINEKTKNNALKILEQYRIINEKSKGDKGANSPLHFIEKTEELLR